MESKLDALVGKEFFYKDKNILITKWKKVAVSYVVFTSSQTYNFFETEIDNFILELKDKKEVKELLAPKKTDIISPESKTLSETLLETLNMVKTDRNYIPQANAICNIVSQLINIQKIELQIRKK